MVWAKLKTKTFSEQLLIRWWKIVYAFWDCEWELHYCCSFEHLAVRFGTNLRWDVWFLDFIEEVKCVCVCEWVRKTFLSYNYNTCDICSSGFCFKLLYCAWVGSPPVFLSITVASCELTFHPIFGYLTHCWIHNIFVVVSDLFEIASFR